MTHLFKRCALCHVSLVCVGLLAMVLCVDKRADAQTQQKTIEEFDIVSLKLHMSGSEVIQVLHTRFGIDPAKDLIVGKKPGMYDPKLTFIPYVQYRAKDFTVKVEFAEIFPVSSKRREGAYRIFYSSNTKTQADVEVMRQKVLEKYGPPTAKGPTGDDEWCQTAPCDVLNKAQLDAGPIFDGGFSVNLRDEGFRKRMEEAFNKTKTGSSPL